MEIAPEPQLDPKAITKALFAASAQSRDAFPARSLLPVGDPSSCVEFLASPTGYTAVRSLLLGLCSFGSDQAQPPHSLNFLQHSDEVRL